MRRVCEDATAVVSVVGLPYPDWTRDWPLVIEGLLAGARGKRLVFADNLYAYGPQSRPLTPDMPFTELGRKPALRARLDLRMLQAARAEELLVALVRASDFYGPRVRASLLGEQVFGPAVRGNSAQLLPGVDQPHALTYIEDFAKALVNLAIAPDDAFGRSWHVPNAPTRTVRQVVEMLYAVAGHSPKMTVMPGWMLSALGWVSPLMREIGEMRNNLEHPYLVDSSDFSARFGWDATSFEDGLAKTLEWYRGLKPADRR